MDSIVSYIKSDDCIYLVSDVIRLESIKTDFGRVKTAINIPLSTLLVHVNKTADQHQRIASILKDNVLRQIVEDRFAEDMACFGY